jgi:hypothetical protein
VRAFCANRVTSHASPARHYNPTVRRPTRILLNAATVTSLVLFAFASVFAFVATQNPGVYPIEAGPRTTYFIVCAPARLRLVRQNVSPPTDPAFAASTSTLDVVRVLRAPGGESMAGFGLSNFGPASGFEWSPNTFGWSCPPGTSGSIGLAKPSSVFRFNYTSASVPHWFALLATATLPLLLVAHRVAAFRRAKHAPEHPCATCGYDLRATPDRCPECGAAPRETIHPTG